MPRSPRRPVEPTTAEQIFGAELRYWRLERGLGVAELANVVGRDRRTISGAEEGRDIPSEMLVGELDEFLQTGGMLLSCYEAVVVAKRRRRMNRGARTRAVAPDASDLDASEFVNETVPDGAIVDPGQRFDKTWTIRNSGQISWVGRHLSRVGSPSGVGLITTPVSVPISQTRPGELVEISVPCVAHRVEGTSVAAFKMTDAEGRLYFPGRYEPGLQVQVTVT